MNSQNLFDLYVSQLNGLSAFSNTLDENDDCDGPFLMAEPTENFVKGRDRLLIVGQETNGWVGGFCGNSEADLAHNVETYQKFNFGENYQNLFFPYARELTTLLTGSESWMWSNLYKFGKDSDMGAPSEKINDLELTHFDVFRDEIRIINPTCVIFMTGPYYDSVLQQRVPDAIFSPMGEFGLRQLAKITSEFLPKASYRLYHPGYGNRHTEMYRGTFDLVRDDYFSQVPR